MLDVWKMGFTGKGVVVAVVDEGIEKNHKELRKNFVSMKHFFSNYSFSNLAFKCFAVKL